MVYRNQYYDTDVGYRRSDKYYDLLYDASARVNQYIVLGDVRNAILEMGGIYDLVCFRIDVKRGLPSNEFDTAVSKILSLYNGVTTKNEAANVAMKLRRYLFKSIGRAGLYLSEEEVLVADPSNAIEEGLFGIFPKEKEDESK
jgi:hypothetical protein